MENIMDKPYSVRLDDGPIPPDTHFARVAQASAYIRDSGKSGVVIRFERGDWIEVRRVKAKSK